MSTIWRQRLFGSRTCATPNAKRQVFHVANSSRTTLFSLLFIRRNAHVVIIFQVHVHNRKCSYIPSHKHYRISQALVRPFATMNCDSIACLNAKAVGFMSTGNYRHALTQLQIIIALLRAMHNDKTQTFLRDSVACLPNLVAGPVLCRNGRETQDDCRMLFDRPILFAISDADIGGSTLVQARIVASVLYNMALVLHVTGVSGISHANDEKQLMGSLSLYNKAIGILNCVAPLDAETCILQMALWNNAIHIYVHFCLYQEARPYAEQLWQFLIEEEETLAFYSTIGVLQGWAVHAATA
jgi:hypothetical protein